MIKVSLESPFLTFYKNKKNCLLACRTFRLVPSNNQAHKKHVYTVVRKCRQKTIEILNIKSKYTLACRYKRDHELQRSSGVYTRVITYTLPLIDKVHNSEPHFSVTIKTRWPLWHPPLSSLGYLQFVALPCRSSSWGLGEQPNLLGIYNSRKKKKKWSS